jgi:enterobacterial common antigen flippase
MQDSPQVSKARAWVGTLIANIVIVTIGFATGILAARGLQPAGRGMLAALIFWPQLIASIGFFSLSDAIVVCRSKHDLSTPHINGAALLISALLCVATICLGYTVVLQLLGHDRGIDSTLASRYFIAYVPLSFVPLTILAAEQSNLQFTRFNLFRLVPSIIYLVALIYLWVVDAFTVAACLWANLLAAAVSALVVIALRTHEPHAFPHRQDLVQLLGQAARIHMHSLLFLLGMHADRAVALASLGNWENGIYIVAWSVASTSMGVVNTAFAMVTLPFAARYRADANNTGGNLTRAIRQTVLITSTVLLAAMLLNPFVTPILFGASFTAAVMPCAVLLVAYGLNVVRQVIISTLKGLEDNVPGIASELTSLATFAMACIPLANAIGMMGIAMALALGNCFGLGALAFYLRRNYGISFKECNGFTPATLWEIARSARTALDVRR